VLSSSPLEQLTTHTIAKAMAHAFRNPLIPAPRSDRDPCATRTRNRYTVCARAANRKQLEKA
jgi:hypothetical protein